MSLKASRSPALAVAAGLGLAACSDTEPVVVISPSGQVLRGTAAATLSGGSFHVSDGKLTCNGNYDSLDTSTTITMQTLCSDGRKGFVVVTREPNLRSGHGKVRLNDGSEYDLIFGHAAENF